MNKTLKDLIKEMPQDQMLSHLDTVKSYFKNAIEHIEKQPRSHKTIIHSNLCKLLIEKITMIQNGWEQSIDIVASSCRYFFETNLLLKYLELKDANYDAFVASAAFDEIEIYEGVLTLQTVADKTQERKILLEHIDFVKALLVKHKCEQYTKEHKLIKSMRGLAEATKCESEYDAFYKLFSKYLHPSSWIVNKADASSITFKNLFLIQAQLYAGEVIGTFNDIYSQDFIKSEGSREGK